MSVIYDVLKKNNLLDEDKLELVEKFHNYLISQCDIKRGIDSEEAENKNIISIITHPSIKGLNNEAFVKALDIITYSSAYRMLLETLLEDETLKTKWDSPLLDYLSDCLFKNPMIQYDLDIHQVEKNNVKEFVQEEPAIHILISKRFSNLSKEQFDKELDILLKSRIYYINMVASVLENNVLDEEKRKIAIDIINENDNEVNKEEEEYQKDYEEMDDLDRLDFKETVATVAVSPVMASKIISIEKYTSILSLLDQGIHLYDTKRDEKFRAWVIDCMSYQIYIENEHQLFRNFDYLFEHYEDTALDYALEFAASKQACYYNDEEFFKATEILKLNSCEDKTFVSSAYSFLTNENISYETNKEEYFALLDTKNILEIKKETAFNNYLAFQSQIEQEEKKRTK